MKKPVTQFDLAAAFKALDEIEYEVVESNPVKNSKKLNESLLKETCKRVSEGRKLNIERLVEDYYDLDDEQDLTQAADDREAEIAQAKLARIEKIVDLDAQTADELLDSYVGKVIVRCPQCMNMFYKNEEDIVKDEEDPTICNVNEPCQHCGNISGYEIIGKVDKLSPEDTAQLSGEEAPAEGEEDLDLNLDVTEEAPAEENAEGTEEAPAEEGAEDDLDLDLDLDLEEPAQESLNAAKAAKSDFESKNETENKTLNEDIDKDVKELDDKLKAHNDYIEYLKNEIVDANKALEGATNDEVKAAIQRKLDALNADLEAALPDAVKTDATPDEIVADDVATDDVAVEAEAEGAVEDLPVETEVEAEVTEEEPTEESLNASKAAKSDFESDNGTENGTLNEGLTEANKNGRTDDDDFYQQDINDAVIQLKKTGHAEFWCRDGKAKADEVVKLVKDKYGKKVEYSIDDDYCSAKVVKEDLHEDVASLLNAFEASLDDVAPSADPAVEESLDNEETFTNPVVVDLTEGGNIGKITVEAGDEALAKEVDKLASEKYVAEDQARAGFEYFDEIAAEKGLKYNPVFDESVNKAEADKNTAPENESENKSINECGENCEGVECQATEEEPKAEDKPLDEAVAITISVDEIDDQVVANSPAETMIIAEPEATAVYDQPEFPAIEIEPQEIENPFNQEFETPADFVGDYRDDSDVDDNTDTEEDDDESDDDTSDDDTSTDVEETDAKDEESEEDDEDDEEVEESLKEGIFDSIKNKASQAKSERKGKTVEDGFNNWKVVSTANDGKSTIKDFTSYAEARNYAIALSKQMSVKQALIKATDTTGVESAIDGYVKGKQAPTAKNLFKKAQLAAQGAAALGNTLDTNVQADEEQAAPEVKPEAKPEIKPEVKPTRDALAAALKDAGYKDLKTIQSIVNALAAKNLVTEAVETTESLNEDLGSATDDAVAKLQQLADQGAAELGIEETPAAEPQAEPQAETQADAPAQEEPVEEGIISAVGDVVNGVVDGAKELLADNASDKDGVEITPIADQIHASANMGTEKPEDGTTTEALEEETEEAEVTEEALEEDANGVSDAEFEQMINSKVFQDFNEEVNVDDIEDIDEESVNECTTNYLKEVYSNVDKFELTKADVTNGILVLEGLIKFHSGNTRNTTFGYNLAKGKHLSFAGVNEDLAKNGQFNIQCSLNNKSLVVESLSYKHEVNGQLVEGLVHKN